VKEEGVICGFISLEQRRGIQEIRDSLHAYLPTQWTELKQTFIDSQIGNDCYGIKDEAKETWFDYILDSKIKEKTGSPEFGYCLRGSGRNGRHSFSWGRNSTAVLFFTFDSSETGKGIRGNNRVRILSVQDQTSG